MTVTVCVEREEEEPSCFAVFLQGFTGEAGPEGPQGPVGMYVSDSVARLKKITVLFSSLLLRKQDGYDLESTTTGSLLSVYSIYVFLTAAL